MCRIQHPVDGGNRGKYFVAQFLQEWDMPDVHAEIDQWSDSL